MKLPEIIQNIKSTLYFNKVPNTHNIDDRRIIYWINEQRALWLKREYNKMREPKTNERQILYNINMEAIKDKNNPIILSDNTYLLRSTSKIPRTIEWTFSDGVTAVRGSNKLSKRINYTSREDVIYKGNGWFNKNKIWAFKDDDYVWIKYANNADKTELVKNIQLEGIFENPIDVDIFNGTPLSIKKGEEPYPVSLSFAIYIETEILKLNAQNFILDENTNDEEDTIRANK